MYRASSILKDTRQDKDLTIEEIAKKIKVPAKYLTAIENESQKCFPPQPYCSLIVKDYASFLGLNGEELLRFFHRDFDTKKPKTSATKKVFGLTPQFTFSVIVVVLIMIFSFYLTGEYFKFNRPPKLKVNWPSSPVTGEWQVSGTTDTESTVRINQDLIIVDPKGNFVKKFHASSPYKVTIESRSPNGKTTVEEKTL